MPFQIRLLVMASGERLPLLCDAAGQPLDAPLLYTLTELRARGLSTATIRHAAHAIKVLLQTLDQQNIVLELRLMRGEFVQLHEIDLVVREAAQAADSRSADLERNICSTSAATRLHYMHAYLRWLGYRYLLRLEPQGTRYLELRDRIDKACKALRARAPSVGVRSDIDERQGLDEAALERVVNASTGSNEVRLWCRAHAEQRNRLILRWLIELGVRRGELLGVRVSDIDFQQNQVLIARRADDPDDPRPTQPLTKTKARILPLSDDLAAATHDYVMGERLRQRGSGRHGFLFVSGGSGAPLSIAGLSRVFAEMRRSDPALPAELTPHVLRHTWNDSFSLQMEKLAVDPETEKRMRSMLMGWSMTSDTASTYTKRFVRKAASQAMTAMQEVLKFKGSTR
ncbi:site-specific integrase [Pelomonas sp. APW6]|uniref:Site-specific integrase n=1 Tax=Roseateles subflavus TaxID=3053353 RepID=A0ABT7LDN9_9BURK|nr:site-specific integrase [Pelomonas sp. APW6]MDL5030958.1 site-specific integrase [Pelomonas sp. APW6]